MLRTKDDLAMIIQAEWQDRFDSDVEEVELNGLEELKEKILAEAPLSFHDYQWLCDLVSAYDQEYFSEE
jgi:hypothetical protein